MMFWRNKQRRTRRGKRISRYTGYGRSSEIIRKTVSVRAGITGDFWKRMVFVK